MSTMTLLHSSSFNESAESEKNFKQLLEHIQHCQRRYGGKTELATELDSCILGLCSSLESVFLHGLKNKPLHFAEQHSTLKHVSAIVANSFGTGNNEVITFWPFIKRHLTKHEQERYAALKQVWTDIGYGRAWIRSTLNEHSLERYVHMILSRPEILTEYYESWAILCDEDKNSMLPNMAGGLGSILFAISIDKPELNKGLSRKNNHFKNKVEPIIESPTPVFDSKLKKKKQKVARQYISFEDTSASDPSSSSNFGSDISLGDHRKSHKDITYKSIYTGGDSINELKTNLKMENKKSTKRGRDMSIETSEAHENFQTSKPQILTPVNNIDIGELTPVMQESNTNYQSTDESNDLFEIPADVSAVLTTLEVKNEELRKKDDKIRSILKENEHLQQQIKKYVSAIHMLKEDDNSELDTLLNELDLGDQTDYEKEAKLFQQKLIEVAEMHAELIDFNSTLQHKLAEKEAIIDQLKSELEVLRGPVPSHDLGGNSCVQVWIPSTFLTGTGSSAHHVYQIFLRAGNDEWNIYRRYTQFHALHTELRKLDPIVTTFDFPPKNSIRRKSSAFVEDRRKRLQIYLRKVIMHWSELSFCTNRFSLEQHLSFFKDEEESINRSTDSSRSQTFLQSSIYTGL